MRKFPDFISILKIRNYSIFSLGQAVSQFGDQLDHMALLALVAFFSPRSTLALSQLGIFITLPVLLFGPVVGILVDRWNKKMVLVICDLLRAFLVAMIPFSLKQTGTIYSVYSIVFFVFLLTLFFNTAKMSVIPNLVEKQKLFVANSLNTFIGRFATVGGTVLGGLIVGWVGWKKLGLEAWEAGFYLDSLSYLISMIALITITIQSGERSSRKVSLVETRKETVSLLERTFEALIREISEVFRLIMRERMVFFVLSSVILVSIIGGGIYVLVTVIVQQLMNWGPKGVGFLGGITAIGMITGSLLIGMVGIKFPKHQIILLGLTALGILIIIFSRSTSFLILAPLAFVAGMILSPISISQDTLLHETVPEFIRGRIFGTREIIVNGTFAAAAFIIGFLADLKVIGRFGVKEPERAVLLGIGVIILLLSLLGQLWARKLKHP